MQVTVKIVIWSLWRRFLLSMESFQCYMVELYQWEIAAKKTFDNDVLWSNYLKWCSQSIEFFKVSYHISYMQTLAWPIASENDHIVSHSEWLYNLFFASEWLTFYVTYHMFCITYSLNRQALSNKIFGIFWSYPEPRDQWHKRCGQLVALLLRLHCCSPE